MFPHFSSSLNYFKPTTRNTSDLNSPARLRLEQISAVQSGGSGLITPLQALYHGAAEWQLRLDIRFVPDYHNEVIMIFQNLYLAPACI